MSGGPGDAPAKRDLWGPLHRGAATCGCGKCWVRGGRTGLRAERRVGLTHGGCGGSVSSELGEHGREGGPPGSVLRQA